MYVDSKERELNIGEIVFAWLKNNPDQPYSPAVMSAAIIQELNEPNVETKQFGNTLFEVIRSQNKAESAFFKAFNADTGANFVENSKMFCVWARKMLGLKTLVTEFTDPALERLFKIISMNPPLPGMGYQTLHMESGATRIVLNLGA